MVIDTGISRRPGMQDEAAVLATLYQDSIWRSGAYPGGQTG